MTPAPALRAASEGVPEGVPAGVPAGVPEGTPLGWAGHARGLLGLAVPLILSNLAGFAVGITDVVLMGRYDVTALAGMVLATSLYFIVFLTGSGFAIAVMPLVATAASRGDEREVRRVVRMGLWLCLACAALALPLLLAAGPLFRAIGQDPEVAEQAGRYLRIGGWIIVPALLISLLRSVLSALERTAVLLWVTVALAVANGLLAFALIFGRWGAPEMGIEGAAWASLVANLLGCAALLAYTLRALPRYRFLSRLWVPDWAALSRVVCLGLPIGGQLLAEVGLFAGSATMVGWVGAVPLAAHGIALQLASAAFMLHLGLSQAATVRAGQALGRGDRAALRGEAKAAVALSATFALLTSGLFLLVPDLLVGAFVRGNDPARPEVLAVGGTLLALAALFQLFDGAQVLAMGLLRGLQDTAVPMVMAAVSYWLVGLPIAYALGFGLTLDPGPGGGWEEVGIWIGLVLGLVAASSLLMARFWARAARPLDVPA